MASLRIGLCQMNASVGDFHHNERKIISCIKKARLSGVNLLIFPELALVGYSPMDQLYYSSFMRNVEASIEKIRLETDNITIILGAPGRYDTYSKKNLNRRFYNSAYVIGNRDIIKVVNKTLIPNYDVFNEKRYFISPDVIDGVVNIDGVKIGIEICEDMWDNMPFYSRKITDTLKSQGAEIIINLSASPFSLDKEKERLELVKQHVSVVGIPYIYLNTVGGFDSIVFDGRSFIVDQFGELRSYLSPFREELLAFDYTELLNRNGDLNCVSFDINNNYNNNYNIIENHLPYNLSKEQDIYESIIINLRDYLGKIKFDGKLILGLSGGIDSAVTAVLCAHAVGSDRVVAVSMPSKFSSDHSIDDSRILAENLGIQLISFPIKEIHDTFNNSVKQYLGGKDWSVADENIQARIRGNILMYISNRDNYLVISTGNKSEIAVGYCTLYGDTVGGKNLIGDLYKREVYALAHYLNSISDNVIPNNIIDKPPSAELKFDQKDSDSLPEYDILDSILELLIDKNMDTQEIINQGFDGDTVRKVVSMVMRNEYKRDQMVQSVKIHDRAFGIGRQFPIASIFNP